MELTLPQDPLAAARSARRWRAWSLAVFAILSVVIITIWQLGGPNALLSQTTTTGGDTGAHYITAYQLRSFLAHGHLTGWSWDWYDGYPLYTFYFVLPDVLAALASYVIPYTVAFKLATVLGSLLLPLGAWLCAKGFGCRRPIPELAAVAMLWFLFESSYTTNQTIDGGNLFSTLAGEYAYSLSLALMLAFVGLFARGIRTGERKLIVPGALLLALCLGAHLLPFFFAVVAGLVMTLIELTPIGNAIADDGFGARSGLLSSRTRTRTREHLSFATAVGVLGVALMAWWVLPFATGQPYTTTMGYTNLADFGAQLFPAGGQWVVVMAAVAFLVACYLRSRYAITLSVLAIISAVAFIVDPQGSLYNLRLLPFWFLCCYLLVAWALAVAIGGVALGTRRWKMRRFAQANRARPRPYREAPGATTGLIAGVAVMLIAITSSFATMQNFWNSAVLDHLDNTFGTSLHLDGTPNQVASWAAFNYSGYEAKSGWPEFQGLISMMNHAGATSGCGRVMWEYNPNQSRFGTTMALMTFPYWTNGCINSQEGLFFEASGTTPYHFLVQSELSADPSNAVVGLSYSGVDVPLGVDHLQLLGVKYFLGATGSVVQGAAKDPRLTEVATSGPWKQADGSPPLTWHLYKVAETDLVQPLTHQPVVIDNVARDSRAWFEDTVPWFEHPSWWSTQLVGSGPQSWRRVNPLVKTKSAPLPHVAVTHVATSPSTISFHVDRVGVPVLVKASYFPNWHANGASGPYRADPNLMVVVPTANTVTLTYGSTSSNTVGSLVTGATVLLLLAFLAIQLKRRANRTRA